MSVLADPDEVYQLHIWLCSISPMIWRRVLVRSTTTIADLHAIIQILGVFAIPLEKVNLKNYSASYCRIVRFATA